MKPYFEQAGIRIYLGDVWDVVPDLDLSTVGCVIADPPYEQTSLGWDSWPTLWPDYLADHLPESASMWCFGSLRMYMERRDDFVAWKLSQDLVWEKHNGSSFHADRFRRVHETPTHWYRGQWARVYKSTPTTPDATSRQVRRKKRPAHMGDIGESSYQSEDGGPRLMRSVIYAPSCHGAAENETEKPIGIVEPLVRYALAPGATLLEPFMGTGPGLQVAKQLGQNAIGIDLREQQCEVAAKRLTQTMGFTARVGPT